jgi:hypothetical protein
LFLLSLVFSLVFLFFSFSRFVVLFSPLCLFLRVCVCFVLNLMLSSILYVLCSSAILLFVCLFSLLPLFAQPFLWLL